MDYQNLTNEFDSITAHSKQNLLIANKFALFLKTTTKNVEQFQIKTKKALEEFRSEIDKVNFHTTLIDNFEGFTSLFEVYLVSLKDNIDKIDKEIADTVNNYSNEKTMKFNSIKTDFSKMVTLIQEERKMLENTKYDYFESNKNYDDLKKNLTKLQQTKKESKEEINYVQININKLIEVIESNTNSYQNNINKINIILDEHEIKYKQYVSTLRSEEESKAHFYKDLFGKMNILMEGVVKSHSVLTDGIKQLGHEINPNMDATLYMNKFYYCDHKNKNRFNKEKFVDYKLYRQNIEMYSNSSVSVSKDKLGKISLESIQRENSGKAFISYSIKYENEYIDESRNEHLDKVFENLISLTDPLPTEEIQTINKYLNDNLKNNELFLKSLLMHYKTNFFVKIKNMRNFEYLASLLTQILNTIKKNHDLFDLNYLIQFISEKTIYDDPSNSFAKYYLCKLISKDHIFSDKTFWSEMIENKINSLVKYQLQIEMEKKNQSNNPSQVMSKMKNLFNTKAKDNQKVEMAIFYGQLHQEKHPLIALEIIENYIQHFSNFNYDVGESIETISTLIIKLKLDKNYLNYLIAVINSNIFTIKNKALYIEKKKDLMTQENPKKIIVEKSFDTFKDYNNQSLATIAFALRYLTPKDYYNVLLLNKTFNERLSKVIFKNILLKHPDLMIKTRIKIWKSILKYHSIKASCDYQDVIQKAKTTPPRDPSFEIIELDVTRTPFDNNVEENRQSIINILKAVTYQTTKISYSQGMNYMAAFMLLISENETEAFYLFLSMMNSTKYGDLFVNDLDMLKQYFYVFDRLMNILMPELCFYLKTNNITVAYFISPWFITLFSNAYQWINAKENPRILLRIWDLFLFSGWKAIIKVGIALIKHYETTLLNLSFEELLNFLINDSIKFDFFQNENYDNLMNIIDNFKIERGLISNIQNEYELKKKII